MTDAAPTRIVHIIPRDGVGGVETAARSMAARDDLACDFHLLFIAGPTLSGNNSRVEAVSSRSNSIPPAYLATLRRCLAFDPDVVIVSLWRSVPLLVALRLLLPRAKLVMTVNSCRAVHLIDSALFRIGVRLADEVWSDSKTAIVGRGVPAPHRVISFVADRIAPAINPMPRARFTAWARLDRGKRFDNALQLIALLEKRGLDPRFDLYGPDGGELEALKRKAIALGIESRVHFNGPVDRAHLSQITSGASFFLLLSRFEGMAMACVEAMQLGLVPIVTPVGEMALYVVPGKTGILVNSNRLDDAADEVSALLANPARYAAMQARAIDRWRTAPLYSDDVCAAAMALANSNLKYTLTPKYG